MRNMRIKQLLCRKGKESGDRDEFSEYCELPQTATCEEKNTKNEKKVSGTVAIMTVNSGEMGVFLWQFI